MSEQQAEQQNQEQQQQEIAKEPKVTQFPFELVIKAGGEETISFAEHEDLFCAITSFSVSGNQPTKETKVIAICKETAEDEKVVDKTIEICVLKPDTKEPIETEFNCAKENETRIKVDGDCDVKIEGVFFEDNDDDEEEEKKE